MERRSEDTRHRRPFEGLAWNLVLALLFLAAGCHHEQISVVQDLPWSLADGPAQTGTVCHDDIVDRALALDPRTISEPEGKEVWELSLEEAIQIALENNKTIITRSYMPGQVGTFIDQELSTFDTTISFGTSYSQADEPQQTFLNTLGASSAEDITYELLGKANGLSNYGYSSTFGGETLPFLFDIPGEHMTEVSKRNATGGFTKAYFDANQWYQNPASPVLTQVNPAVFATGGIEYYQPLLQGAGIEFNRAPVMIARGSYRESIYNFESKVHELLRDVEQDYWNLYSSYQVLYANEVAMAQALATWQKLKNEQRAGVGSPSALGQALDQYEEFRSARLSSLIQVLEDERALREELGIPPDDGRRIIPADDPIVAEYTPDWQTGVLEAIEYRPELLSQRESIGVAELRLLRERNGLLPDVTFATSYGATGLSSSFGPAFHQFVENRFISWYFGLRYQAQIGERAAHASVRQAQLELSQARAKLREKEHQVIHELYKAYLNVTGQYKVIQVDVERREAAADVVKVQEQLFREGTITIDVLLKAQESLAQAIEAEATSIVAYNQAISDWEYARGTIARNDNVAILERVCRLEKVKKKKRNRWMAMLTPFPSMSSTEEPGMPMGFPSDPGEMMTPTPSTSPVMETPEQIIAPRPADSTNHVMPPSGPSNVERGGKRREARGFIEAALDTVPRPGKEASDTGGFAFPDALPRREKPMPIESTLGDGMTPKWKTPSTSVPTPKRFWPKEYAPPERLEKPTVNLAGAESAQPK
ncbi:Outer membrane efflux protein [Planctomycetes bacterium Pan216]|uniref:Outer membrane efflux protein n=1 Tax=Kolteria novifilia TaxID=2527975 RepID=A0A518BCD5_9BACT|nr:Outer membrane efflux protein [Planctomycetes bacterium Pan216]